jgi:simple sugar transport system substrate-binding protein
MRRLSSRLLLLALALAVAAFAAGCGGGGKKSKGGENVNVTAGKNLTFAVITHGEGDTFWAVAKKGAIAAGKDEGVTVKYSESQNDPQKQAQLISAAVTQKVDGIATSAPDPDAIKDPLKRAERAGIPVITLNSGEADSKALGAITHVGQDESVAGEAAGKRIAQSGAKKLLCVIHEQGNVGLEQRCTGAKKGFGGTVENVNVKGVADISTTLTELKSKLQSDKSIDYVLTLNPDIASAARDAIAGASSSAKLATFDLSGNVIKAIEGGKIQFAIDQQQYLQGYLPVVFLTLYKINNNTVGGGFPVFTGPGFVDKSNASTVAKLTTEGTR